MLFKIDLNKEPIYKKDVKPVINLIVSNGSYASVCGIK